MELLNLNAWLNDAIGCRYSALLSYHCSPFYPLSPALPLFPIPPFHPLTQTWMDVDQMSGSTLEAMAKAVEESCVFIMCVSKKYKESQVGAGQMG